MLVELLFFFWQNYAKIMLFFSKLCHFFLLCSLKKLQKSPKNTFFLLEAVGLQDRNVTNTTMKFK